MKDNRQRNRQKEKESRGYAKKGRGEREKVEGRESRTAKSKIGNGRNIEGNQ